MQTRILSGHSWVPLFVLLLCLGFPGSTSATVYGDCCVPDGSINGFYIEIGDDQYCCACPPHFLCNLINQNVIVVWTGSTIGYRCGTGDDCEVPDAIRCGQPAPLQINLTPRLYASTVTDAICEQCDYVNGCLVQPASNHPQPITYVQCDCTVAGCIR